MKRVLLLLPAASYRNEDFLAAARRLRVETATAADYCPKLAPGWGLPPAMAVPFDRPDEAATVLLDAVDRPDAVLAVDDRGVELAALLAERWELPGNPLRAVRTVRDKLLFRQFLRANRMACPNFAHLADDGPPAGVGFPLVVKARRLSASRGVVRADDLPGYRRAVAQVRGIQKRADRDADRLGLVVEEFIPGAEVALEGILEAGRLRVLALFDKPDPLDGPYFEETLYVTPSRLSAQIQEAIAEAVGRACRSAGLVRGPVHAEARVNSRGVWLLEVAPRSIGGLCGRVLEHALGMTLEELILRAALGEPLPEPRPEAAGVMMIPIPRRGVYRGTSGVAEASTVSGVTAIRIVAEPGQQVAPPPDGAGYLGFVFARGGDAAAVERALRDAHGRLRFDIRTDVPLLERVP